MLSIFFGGLGVLAYLVLWIVLPQGTPVSPALEIAEQRYARGEIDAEELERIRANLAEQG